MSEVLSVGYSPQGQLQPQDQQLFRAFQANLLSLISHELRTPLTIILNSLNALSEEGDLGEMSATELISMAKVNAVRLNQTLSSLLDIASIESGNFHAHLREVSLRRLVKKRFEVGKLILKSSGITAEIEDEAGVEIPVLADAQKLGRLVDLVMQILATRAETGSRSKLLLGSTSFKVDFTLPESGVEDWGVAWSQALAGFEGGVASPTSAFAGVVQSETAFLSRTREGLGSELILLHEILRLHQGELRGQVTGRTVSLEIWLPELSSEQALRAVLDSRIFKSTTEIGTAALILFAKPEDMELKEFQHMVRKQLFRATDSVYVLKAREELAVVMDDCRKEDIPKLIHRIEKGFQGKKFPNHGTVLCPDDGTEAAALIALASRRRTS